MRFSKSLLFYLGLICLVSLFSITACGKKGPVLAPIKTGDVLAAPENLKYTLEGNQIILTWTHAVDPVNARLKPQAFNIYMATKELEGCEGCPFVFENTGLVPMPDMVHRQHIPLGRHNYFRVQAIGENDIKSDYSKTVYIDFEK
jgi:predicted small lipoprotein YifL